MKYHFLSKTILSSLIILNLNHPLSAGNGNTSANFLSQNLSARSVAMGGLFTTTALGAESITSNPTGMALVDLPETLISFASTQNNSAHGFVGYVYPFKINALQIGLGTAISYFTAGNIDINYLDGTTRSYNAERSYSGSIGISAKYKWIGFGISPKAIRSTLVEQYTATAYAADIGILLYPLREHFKEKLILGIAFQNLGTKISYKSKSHELPANKSLGVSVLAFEHRTYGSLLLSTQGEVITGETVRFRFGGEYTLKTAEELRTFFFRGGYRFHFDNENYSAGIGIREKNFELNYSFVNSGILENTHLLSIGFKFGTINAKVFPDLDVQESQKEFEDQSILKNQLIDKSEKIKNELLNPSETTQNEKDKDVLEIKKEMNSENKNQLPELMDKDQSEIKKELFNKTEEQSLNDE